MHRSSRFRRCQAGSTSTTEPFLGNKDRAALQVRAALFFARFGFGPCTKGQEGALRIGKMGTYVEQRL